jgi:hypothetical protein
MHIRITPLCVLAMLQGLSTAPSNEAMAATEQRPPAHAEGADLTKMSNSRAMPPVGCTDPQSCELTFRLENVGYKDGGDYVVSWLKNMTIRLIGQGGQDQILTDFDLQNVTANTSEEQNTISVSLYGSFGQLLKTITVNVERKRCGHVGPRHIEEASPDIIHSIASYRITQSTLSAAQGVCGR